GAYTGHRITQASGSFSLVDGAAKIDLDYSGSLAGEPVAFKLAAEGLSTKAPASAPVSSPLDFLSGYRAEGVATAFSFGSFRSARWPFAATLGEKSVSIVGGEGKELSLRYAFDGSFDAAIGAPLPISLTASGKTDGVTIDANVRGLDFGLTALTPFIPPSIMIIEEGKAQGSGHIRGLLADPEIDGEFKLAGVVLRVPDWLVDKVGPFDAPILTDGRTVIAVSPAMKVGAATVAARAECVLDHWTPVGLKGTIKSAAGPKVKLKTVLLGIQAQGDANLDFKASLDGDVVNLDGDVSLDKAVVVVSPETIAGAPPGPPGEAPTLFLALTTRLRFGRGAQVFFPSREFPIVAGYAEPSSALAISYSQADEDFSVRGDISLRGGDVFYIQRNFFLKSAKISFNENTTRFDPRVTVLAELRDRNDEGPVLVTLRADNAPISSFKPRLISDPPMTEAQIAALLGANLFGLDEDSQLDIRHALISGTEFIPQLNVIKSFERKVRELLGLDIFYLRTRMLQRWLIDLSFNEMSGVNTLGHYLDETSAYAGKYLSDSIFAHGAARLREDPLAASGALRLDWEAGVEFDTPYGLVQWTIAPSNPNTLFITDQSLSLSWRLAY
ncbi:MAG: translocation/assembly module TamB domain-containing protein, partial [Spirochaetaceae bacterium]|nr:translocation/assembly module TamB domain-containing protein [Spirochaetaceae bacterium]